MIDYYNAFISYRHAELDSKVAEHVQRNLERFHIPHRIRKKTGKKKIERIFRDKDELPITSDLTDTISNALEKADYLIVICSPNTKDSVWVQREMEYFLRNHTKKEILTVLAGGEPEDVIPDILKHDIRKVTDSKGEVHEVETPVEPLSCDYRMPFARAKKEELPRLAAAVVGCSYDELVRRQRAYRMRRNMAIGGILLAAALAFGGYMFYSKQKINAAYRDSLVSRSKYLSNESEKLLDKEEDRIGALFLALEALPKEGEDYPVTTDAVHALTRATLAYKGTNGLAIHSTWNYSQSNQLRSFVLNEDGTRLAAIDSSSRVIVWNTEDHRELFVFHDPDNTVRRAFFADNGTLLLLGDSTLRALNADDGKDLWFLTEKMGIVTEDPVMTGDGSVLCAVRREPEVIRIDLKSGDIVARYDLSADPNGEKASVEDICLSPSEDKIAYSSLYNGEQSYCGVYDIKTGKVVVSGFTDNSFNSLIWVDNDHLLASSYDIGSASAKMMKVSVLNPYSSVITSYNSSDMKPVWTAEQITSDLAITRGMILLGEEGLVAYYAGDLCCAYDVKTGEKVYEWHTDDPIIDVSDRDGDGMPMIITRGGGIGFPQTSNANDVLRISDALTDEISKLTVNNGIYLLKSYGTDVIYYETGVHDDEWQETPDSALSSVGKYLVTDKVVAVLTTTDKGNAVMMIDPGNNTVIGTHLLIKDDVALGTVKILGSDDDNLYVIKDSKEGIYVAACPISGDAPVEHKLYDGYSDISKIGKLNDGMVCGYYGAASKSVYWLWDSVTGEIKEYEPSLPEDFRVAKAPQYYKEAGLIYLPGDSGDYIFDLADGKCISVDIPEGWDGTKKIEFDSPDSRFIISDNIKILTVNTDGTTALSLSCDSKLPLGFMVAEDPVLAKNVLYVAYSESELCRYDANTGEFISSTPVSSYQNITPEATLRFDEKKEILYIQMEELVVLVDTNDWIELAYVTDCIGYNMPYDRFYTYSPNPEGKGKVIGYFRHYDLKDLKDKAYRILEGQEMPEDMRSQFGL